MRPRDAVIYEGPSRLQPSRRAAALPRLDSRDVAQTLAHLGLSVRLGAWGDPVALPPDVVLPLAGRSTGYTHAWRLDVAAPCRGVLMASVASPEDRTAARAMGWRTYRISSRPAGPGEIACPGQLSPGARRPRKTCAQCLACSGADRPGLDVVARPHGQLRGRVYP